jgi:hypothetical protein
MCSSDDDRPAISITPMAVKMRRALASAAASAATLTMPRSSGVAGSSSQALTNPQMKTPPLRKAAAALISHT